MDSQPTEELLTTRLKSAVTKRKGRGFSSAADPSGLSTVTHFDTLYESSGRALRSVEGWVLFVTGLHEEVTEEDLYDRFADYGTVRDLKMDLDHRTGYVKGYALVEYLEYAQAKEALDALNGSSFMDGILNVDFAFSKPPA
jgi:RNA-binding protein 8A